MRKRIMLAAVLCLSAGAVARGQSATQAGHAGHPPGEMAVHTAVDWKDGPGSLPAGAKFAVLEGDPSREGPFTMRLWLPDGFRIPPHWHPKVERITVISGVFNLGMGEKFDQSATRELPAGTYAFWPAGMRHFVWVKGDTVLQLHGTGPWAINYVNPADDPRHAKK